MLTTIHLPIIFNGDNIQFNSRQIRYNSNAFAHSFCGIKQVRPSTNFYLKTDRYEKLKTLQLIHGLSLVVALVLMIGGILTGKHGATVVGLIDDAINVQQ